MPNDGQDFETLVELIERSIAAPNATVERNAQVPERDGGKLRQVDVWITIRSGHGTVTIAAEAKDHRRPVNLTIMEQTIKKHEKLGTGRLIVYSARGFSANALDDARRHGVLTIVPEDLGDDADIDAVVHSLTSLWMKLVGMRTTSCRLVVHVGSREVQLDSAPMVQFLTEDGSPMTTVREALDKLCQSYLDVTQVEIVKDIAESGSHQGKLDTVTRPECYFHGERVDAHVRVLLSDIDEDGEERPLVDTLLPVERIEADVVLDVRVEQIDLDHQRFGDAVVSHGAGDEGSLAVVSLDGQTTATVALPDGRSSTGPFTSPPSPV